MISITSKANPPNKSKATLKVGRVGWSRSHSDFVVIKSSQYSPIGASSTDIGGVYHVYFYICY